MHRLALALSTLALAQVTPKEPPAEGPDRSTPFASVTGYQAAVRSGDYRAAAAYLWPGDAEASASFEERTRDARRLRFVLDRALWVDTASLSHEAAGDPADARFDVVGEVPVPRGKVPIRLARVTVAGAPVWLFSQDTVRAIAVLFAQYGPPFSEALPDWLYERSLLGLELWQWLGLALTLVLATACARLLQRVALSLGVRLTRRTKVAWDDRLLESLRGPLSLLMWALIAGAGVRALFLPPGPDRVLGTLAGSVTIASIVWFLLRLLDVVVALVAARPEALDGRGRALRTQFELTRQVLQIVIWLVGVAVFLLQFEVVRSVGVSLLASAGIASVFIGLAAQKSLGSLFAGIQLSLTEPVRLGDLVVVAGHTGVVEELRLTYVVVRTWDHRRVVVPINDFLDKPFENWSRGEGELFAFVSLKLDYTVDLEALRAEVDALVATEPVKALWNGNARLVQAVDNDDRTVTVRVALTANTIDQRGDLANVLRERLLRFVTTAHPEWLPLAREAQRSA